MFELFRFTMLRPPETVEFTGAINVNAESEFVSRLRKVRSGDVPLKNMRQIADEFIDSDSFVRNPSSIGKSISFDNFQNELNKHLLHNTSISTEEINNIIKNNFDLKAHELVEKFKQDKERLHDSIIAVKFGSKKHNLNVDHIWRYIRLIALIEDIAKEDQSVDQQDEVHKRLNYNIVLPSDLFPLPPEVQTGEQGKEDGNKTGSEKIEDLLEKYQHLQTAHDLLMQLELEDVSIEVSSVSKSIKLPTTVYNESEKVLLDYGVKMLHNEVDRLSDDQLSLQDKLKNWHQLHDFITNERLSISEGHSSQEQSAIITVPKLTLKPDALKRFSDAIKKTLEGFNIALDSTNLPDLEENINMELRKITPQAISALHSKATGKAVYANVIPIGNQFFRTQVVNELHTHTHETSAHNPMNIPSNSSGMIKLCGVGDLLVVSQQLIGYEKGEVAHIENILTGEIQKREIQRSESTEISTFKEQESTKEEERDQQSTERFEMHRESQNILALDGQVRGRSLQSSNYGPLIEFENNDQAPLLGSQQLSERNATNYSKDITNRAVSRITERVVSQTMRRVVHHFEEKIEHSYNNSEGTANVIGIYQWINKIYQAQVYHYGKRLFYDLVVPEPGAFLLQAFANAQEEGRGLVKPDSFTVPLNDGTERALQPDDITDTTYTYYTAKYQATGVKSPPQLHLTVTKIFAGTSEPTSLSLELSVPEGYEPTRKIIYQRPQVLPRSYTDKFFSTGLDISLSKGKFWLVQLNCHRKTSFYEQWQLNTYEAILHAYRQQMAAYEERLANLQAAYRINALGQSDDQKRIMERTELKKACITLFTNQHFGFNAIESPKDVNNLLYPQLNLNNTESVGRYIRFFEQAFEWDQMMYNLYPYFWGRKNQWLQKVIFDDRDPHFAEFLSAGAARALVSVKPGFEKAIIHYFETREIWEGSDLPEINSTAYLPLLEELKTQEKVDKDPLPYGEPWKIKLPTTLIKLRNDNKLPKWKQKNDEWVADEKEE